MIKSKKSLKSCMKKLPIKIPFVIPKIPNFNNKPARNNDIGEFTSVWTSGNHENQGKEGIFIKKTYRINKEKINLLFQT